MTREESLLEDAYWDNYCYQKDRAFARLLFLANLWESNNKEELDNGKAQ